MTILTDLLVGLGVDVGCRDQDAKLAVSQPGDEATGSSLSGSPWGDAVYVFGNRVAESGPDRAYQGKREPDHRTSE